MNSPAFFISCAIPTGFLIMGTLFDYKHFTPNVVSEKRDSLGQLLGSEVFISISPGPKISFVGMEPI